MSTTNKKNLDQMTPSKAEAVEDVLAQQYLLPLHSKTFLRESIRRLDTEFLPLALKHELEEFRGVFQVLVNPNSRRRTQDGEASVHMPFVQIDAEHDVDLDHCKG